MHELSTIFVPSYNFLDVRNFIQCDKHTFFSCLSILSFNLSCSGPMDQIKSAHVSPKFSITWKGRTKNNAYSIKIEVSSGVKGPKRKSNNKINLLTIGYLYVVSVFFFLLLLGCYTLQKMAHKPERASTT